MSSNILFIIIDSLRADKFYGENKSTITPNIDKMIKNGTYFSETISSADVTGICLGNVFTGMFSQKTGITQRKFNSNIKTLFDILKENNYHIYGIVPDLTWFNQLTEKFDETYRYYAANRIQDGLADKIGKQILDRLNSTTTIEPWIYYIHLEDLHEKIIVPAKYDKEEYGITKYERMISYIDEWIGKIYSQCDLEKTLIVITSDHGDYIPVVDHLGQIPRIQSFMKKGKDFFPMLEPLGLKLFILIRNIAKNFQQRKLKKQLSSEQIRTLNARGKKTLQDETLKVPLLMMGNRIPSKIFNNLISGIDLFPTILSYVGIKINDKNIDGRDLNVLMNGGELKEIPIFIQTGDTQEHKESLVIGIRTSKFKYYRARKNPKQDVNLYNLENDPLEKNNIANLFPEVIKSMEVILERYEKQHIIVETKDDDKTKEIEEELKRMGYV
ncbi:sulfatase [Candidatus Nitrosarchaeum limnium SFB1]|jgi:arylsulfatase A-like enzyme|uniref:Sulfatase n=1 Tax=Candidatus Nitrosarchaeum limnium SFB1 TaxID=886738 RepID=F3KMV5_9ARCH|nr:sulfatase [Candidatus Nitrosarchaeum limnium SFB1]